MERGQCYSCVVIWYQCLEISRNVTESILWTKDQLWLTWSFFLRTFSRFLTRVNKLMLYTLTSVKHLTSLIFGFYSTFMLDIYNMEYVHYPNNTSVTDFHGVLLLCCHACFCNRWKLLCTTYRTCWTVSTS